MPSKLRLTDLQTDVLDSILSNLHPPGPLRRRAILSSPASFPLSLTCRRFHTLFRSRLHTIDGCYPETYAPVAGATDYNPVSGSHINTVVRLARNHLKVLRLPRDCTDIHEILLQVPIHRIFLEELAYTNSNFEVDMQTVGAVFSYASSWKRLTIFKPVSEFRFIVLAVNLEELELTGVQPRFVHELCQAFFAVGKNIRVLKLGFMRRQSDNFSPPSVESAWSVKTFANYMRRYAEVALPKLRELEVSVCRCDIMYHVCSAERMDASWVERMSQLETVLTGIREKNAGTVTVTAALRKFTLRATRTNGPLGCHASCLEMFDSVIGDAVDVELQIVGATAVFPAGGGKAWFKALQITRRDMEFGVEQWGFDAGRIEVLDIGSNIVALIYERDGEFREKVLELVGRCAANLKEVRSEVEMTLVEHMKTTCNYVADVLERAVGVKRVYIRTGLVDFAVAGWDEFQRLMRRLDRIEGLRLTTHPCFSPICKMAFGRNLPLFLDEASKHCKSLEYLFLESAMPVRAASIASKEVRDVAMKFHDLCMAAMEKFEAERENCDISTIRAQLARWFVDINRDPPVDLLPMARGFSPNLGPWPPGLGPPPVLPPP